jgi:hypothetical protein
MTRPSICPKKEALRAQLAEQMAAWEAVNGPVVTTPVIARDAPIPQPSIAVPAPKPRAARAARNLPKAKLDAIERRYKKPLVEVAADLARQGLSIKRAAHELELSAQYFGNLIRDTPAHALFFPEKELPVVEGVADSIRNHCLRYGVHRSTVRRRILNGMSLEEALGVNR